MAFSTQQLILSLCASHDPLGRCDIHSLPQQVQMENLVEPWQRTSEEYFIEWVGLIYAWRDADGDFYDTCEWRGVTCDESGDVTKIWIVRALFTGSIDTRWFPSSVTNIELSTNTFYGEVAFDALPSSLVVCCLQENRLTGSIDLCHLPKRLQEINLGKNKFSGSIVLENLPPRLSVLFTHGNALTGTLNLSHLKKPQGTAPWIERTKEDDILSVKGKILVDFSKNQFEGDILVRDVDDFMTFAMFRNHDKKFICDTSGRRRKLDL